MIFNCDARSIPLPDGCVQCVVTSPPYYGLRDYGVEGQIGLEATPEAYLEQMVAVFRDVRRVLKDDGTLWLNMGDSYAGSGKGRNADGTHSIGGKQDTNLGSNDGNLWKSADIQGLKPKDLMMMPSRLALALQADGWYVRSDIIWCLSGGTWLYVKSQKGEMPMMVCDMVRLDPSTVSLWNGKQWTRVLGWNRTERQSDEIELVLRSGERISCTPTHKWPTNRGLLQASELAVGDVLESVKLPEPEQPKTAGGVTLDAAWFVGLYLAEGSRSNEKIQIAGHVKEIERFERVRRIAEYYGGSATVTNDGNKQSIRVFSRLLNAIIDDHISGKVALDKGLKVRCWSYSNEWLRSILDGYLSGDGHWDADNRRWRLGFCRNYNLERDLRVLCARLGASLTLNLSVAKNQDGEFPAFRGEIRLETGEHLNNRSRTEIVEIRKARCREVYDIGVEDDPHVFALASGVLTHNSKPNPMPESVTDRPTRSHEYIFLLSKRARYFYDADAIREQIKYPVSRGAKVSGDYSTGSGRHDGGLHRSGGFPMDTARNKRDVWTINSEPTPEAHFATFPTKLIEPCVLAGTSAKGECIQCGANWVRETEISYDATIRTSAPNKGRLGWRPTCSCDAGTRPNLVFDPFLGSGTVGVVADKLGRRWAGTELNPKYVEIAKRRTFKQVGLGLTV